MRKDLFFWGSLSCAVLVMAFIALPLIQLLCAPSLEMLQQTIHEPEVIASIRLSMTTAAAAALLSFVFGTPLAYLLARYEFYGKRLVEGIIDLPIIIPHPVVGIAILSVTGRTHWFGQLLTDFGIRIMGSVTGIIAVMTFVAIPFYIKAAKEGFESISPRLENVSRSLGASMTTTFFLVTFPLAWRSILAGLIMASARAISEFGAVVIVAYHPMIAPVMIFERFESYGLKYSQPVAVWLIGLCLILFLVLRVVTTKRRRP
ncbi:MAG: ABC transporter permease [Desulfuromonas sp.]|nr:ABC transporter permease [Desulfuromonas sp.]